MANKAVALYQSKKINGKWRFRKAPDQRRRRLSEGAHYISWYEGTRKRMECVGPEPDVALAAFDKKRAELRFVATGGEVRQDLDLQRIKLTQAVEQYLSDCRDRQASQDTGLRKRQFRRTDTDWDTSQNLPQKCTLTKWTRYS